MRRLIVNADDFGLSPGVNGGIIRAHEHGIVTTASLMVRQPAAEEAADIARSASRLGVGLHLDLGEWAYDGERWVTVYQWVDPEDEVAVTREVDHQLAQFEALLGRPPTHLDSHQHVHSREPLRTLLQQRAARLGVPLRHASRGVRYEGRFYGQDDEGAPLPDNVSVSALVSLLGALEPGTTELCCHPAAERDVETAYIDERLVETATLCDPLVLATVERERVQLSTFAEVAL